MKKILTVPAINKGYSYTGVAEITYTDESVDSFKRVCYDMHTAHVETDGAVIEMIQTGSIEEANAYINNLDIELYNQVHDFTFVGDGFDESDALVAFAEQMKLR